MSFFFRLFLCFLLSVLGLQAFPPAPYYTLHGLVRTQVGQTLDVDGAVLILLKDGEEIGRTPIVSNLQIDQNYELRIRIDSNRSGTSIYSEKAILAEGLFSLVVEMNNTLFYPIEVSGDLTAGKGGEKVRLDLNLGADSDGDGLPDTWEEWQLYQAGLYPDENGWDLSLIDRNGDFDQDGNSNKFEYIAGTFAGDATERFELAIKEKLETSVRFEFYQITGKVYTIERSLDFKDWTRVPFTVGAPGTGDESYQANDVGIVSAFAVPSSSTKEFYRLSVR
ncbi:MAG: hypothetical protein ACSHYA_13230 [Opitutaceae bacterium]